MLKPSLRSRLSSVSIARQELGGRLRMLLESHLHYSNDRNLTGLLKSWSWTEGSKLSRREADHRGGWCVTPSRSISSTSPRPCPPPICYDVLPSRDIKGAPDKKEVRCLKAAKGRLFKVVEQACSSLSTTTVSGHITRKKGRNSWSSLEALRW